MKKAALILGVVLAFIGFSAATQPKIVEVTDNSGNTFTVEEIGADDSYSLENGGYFTWREGFARANVQQEVTVTNETSIELCVTEVRAGNKDEVKYDFTGWNLGNHKTDTTDNCHSWNLTQDDIMNSWRFEIKANNNDGTEFAGEGDFRFQVRYHNLVSEGGQSEGQTFNYETIRLSKSKYEELKQPNETLQNKVTQKNEKISQLRTRISELENRIKNLTSQIKGSQNKSSGMSDSSNNKSNSETDTKESSDGNSKGSGSGFLGQTLNWIFG